MVRLLRTCNGVGQFIHVHHKAGETFDARNDLTVFIPDNGEWPCTIEGSPDEPGRCLVVQNLDELWKLSEALNMALAIINEQISAEVYPSFTDGNQQPASQEDSDDTN